MRTMYAAYAARHLPHSVTVGPGTEGSCQPTAKAVSGPARDASPKPRQDGLLQLKVRRAILLHEAARHRNLRQSKQASLTEAELRRVTHQLMGAELGPG